MYIDAHLKLSDAQAVTASAASTNIIDLGAARDIAVGGELQLHVKVDTAVTAAGAATVNFQLQTSADSGFSSPVTVIQSDAIGKAALAQGFAMYLPLPVGLNKRYVRLYYSVGTGPLTAGAFSAAVVEGIQSSPAYAAPGQA